MQSPLPEVWKSGVESVIVLKPDRLYFWTMVLHWKAGVAFQSWAPERDLSPVQSELARMWPCVGEEILGLDPKIPALTKALINLQQCCMYVITIGRIFKVPHGFIFLAFPRFLSRRKFMNTPTSKAVILTLWRNTQKVKKCACACDIWGLNSSFQPQEVAAVTEY